MVFPGSCRAARPGASRGSTKIWKWANELERRSGTARVRAANVLRSRASSRTMAETYPLKFGKYVLLKPLARGGMGAIFLAAAGEPGFQKFCVVKKVIAEKSDRAKANRFLDEAKVVLRLVARQPGPHLRRRRGRRRVLHRHGAGRGEGPARDLEPLRPHPHAHPARRRAARGARDLPARWPTSTTHADLRLVHRDVAPPNILISYFGEVKLTDFGLARSVLKQENTAPGVVFGRASYLVARAGARRDRPTRAATSTAWASCCGSW